MGWELAGGAGAEPGREVGDPQLPPIACSCPTRAQEQALVLCGG